MSIVVAYATEGAGTRTGEASTRTGNSGVVTTLDSGEVITMYDIKISTFFIPPQTLTAR